MATARAPAEGTHGAPEHGLGAGCLRFAPGVSPAGRQTRCRWLARPWRVGWATHRAPTKGSRDAIVTSLPPFPGFAWRNATLPTFPPRWQDGIAKRTPAAGSPFRPIS